MGTTSLDITTVGGRTTLWVHSDKLDEYLAYYKANRIDSLGVNPMRGYTRNELEFLRDSSFVTDITVVAPASGNFDLEPIRALTALRSLTISQPVALSLDQFPDLEEFRGMWHPKLRLLGCRRLKLLDISGYKPKSQNLTELPDLPALSDLILVQASITSTTGVSRFSQLSKLEISYSSKLETLAELSSLSGLAVLACYTCRRLKRHDSVRVLINIRVLRFNDCGAIQNLAFLNDLPKLEEFRFVNTNIVDGDLKPLLRLKWAGFLPKRHYSHTPEEVDAVLRLKGGGAIARIGDCDRYNDVRD